MNVSCDIQKSDNTICEDVIARLDRLTSELETKINTLSYKLVPILKEAAISKNEVVAKECEQYPPLFDELRKYSGRVEMDIDKLDSIIARLAI